MARKYKLLKDLPNVSSGEVGNYHLNEYLFKDKKGGKAFIKKVVVESYPEWFKEVKEQERIEVLVHSGFTDCKNGRFAYTFSTPIKIFSNKIYIEIKQAIEGVLNNKSLYPIGTIVEDVRTGDVMAKVPRSSFIKNKYGLWMPYNFAQNNFEPNTDLFEEKIGQYFKVVNQSTEDTVVKGWEILSLYDGCINGRIDSRCLRTSDGWSDEKIVSLGFTIHSVKRLSDGEVFTIGDLHYGWSYKKNPRAILGFEIENGRDMYIKQEGGNTRLSDASPMAIKEKTYTQQQYDKAIEDAFQTSRWGQYGAYMVQFTYKTFEDYIQSLNK